jgi:diguanylate cyclase (GGDEF)-like protein
MAGVLWLTAALSTALGLLIPGAVTSHWHVELLVAVAMTVWGIACLLIPPDQAGPVIFHAPALLALPVVAINIASTGGAKSYLTYDLFFVISYCAYFYSFRQALIYAALAGLTVAAPLLYDHHAVNDGLLVLLFTAIPAYVVLGVVMASAKSRLVGLRDAAHNLSLADPLTGLPNRRAFSERIGLHIGGQRADDSTGLMLIDIDDFKDANTVYGHPGGDRVLVEAAHALRGAARTEDMVARLGGDEFAVVAHGVDVPGMAHLAERVLHAMRAAGSRLQDELPGIKLTASVGWAIHPHTAQTVEELMAVADYSLRGAKGAGKDAAVSAGDFALGSLPA